MVAPDLFHEKADLGRILGHLRALEGVRHPLAAPDALERAADYVASSLAGLGYDLTEQLFTVNNGVYRNVIATSHGLGSREERVVVLAHYDTVASSPGADDNASGVAVLLEAATLLAAYRFERTIHFIGVSLEENLSDNAPGSGTNGSRALAAYAHENDWSIEGVVVLESVAFAGEQIVQTVPPGVPVSVPPTGNFIAVIGNEASRELVSGMSRAIERQGDLPHVALAVPGNGEVLPDTRRSDHAPFWDAGYRAIMLTDTTNFRNPHYHRPTDTIQTLNLVFATKVCTVTASFVAEVARRLPREQSVPEVGDD